MKKMTVVLELPVSAFDSDESGFHLVTNSGDDIYLNPGDVISVECKNEDWA